MTYVWLILALLAFLQLVHIKQIQRQRLAVELQMQTYYFMLYYDDLNEAMFNVDWAARTTEMAEKTLLAGAQSPAA